MTTIFNLQKKKGGGNSLTTKIGKRNENHRFSAVTNRTAQSVASFWRKETQVNQNDKIHFLQKFRGKSHESESIMSTIFSGKYFKLIQFN